MNKSDLHKNIIKEIQEIYSFINRFENPNQIHQIDIDLAMSKVRNLYDMLLKLNAHDTYVSEYQSKEKLTINKPSEKQEFERTKEVIQNEPQKNTKTPETKQEIENELIIEEIKKPEIKKEIEPVKKITFIEDEKPKKVQEKQKKQESSSEIMADKFHSKTYMHDSFTKGNPDKQDVSSKMKSKPITDINSAIGLNDKFVYVRELFNGNKDQFVETIQLLNNFDSFENALGYLKENFKWDYEEPIVVKLVELVRRKYTN